MISLLLFLIIALARASPAGTGPLKSAAGWPSRGLPQRPEGLSNPDGHCEKAAGSLNR